MTFSVAFREGPAPLSVSPMIQRTVSLAHEKN